MEFVYAVVMFSTCAGLCWVVNKVKSRVYWTCRNVWRCRKVRSKGV